MLADSWVIGELALDHLARRDEILRLFQQLPQAKPQSTTKRSF